MIVNLIVFVSHCGENENEIKLQNYIFLETKLSSAKQKSIGKLAEGAIIPLIVKS